VEDLFIGAKNESFFYENVLSNTYFQ